MSSQLMCDVLLALLVVRSLVIKHAGRCGQLQHHRFIFMRWKEQFFVNTKEPCGLTIAGGQITRHGLTGPGAWHCSASQQVCSLHPFILQTQ
jgi:hypothetical protein